MLWQHPHHQATMLQQVPPMVILIAVSMEAIVIPCSLNSVQIFSAKEVSLSNTLAIVSLKLVIWDFNL